MQSTISSIRAGRPIGVRLNSSSKAPASMAFLRSGVSTYPGQMALMRIPSLENAMASWPGGRSRQGQRVTARRLSQRWCETYRPRHSHYGVFPGRVRRRRRHERRTHEAANGGSIDDDAAATAAASVAVRIGAVSLTTPPSAMCMCHRVTSHLLGLGETLRRQGPPPTQPPPPPTLSSRD